MQRTKIIDTPKFVGQQVKLAGWVNVRRDHGKITFIDLRDASGIIQTVVIPDYTEAYETAKKLRSEFVIEMEGLVKERPMSAKNEKSATGGVELEVSLINILNESKTPPFEITKDTWKEYLEFSIYHRLKELTDCN